MPTVHTESGSGPRRSLLAQDRSRRTRDALVEAATALWGARDVETGFDGTTVDEIAQAAGVTKGTFYFHFGSKVDILHELNDATEEAVAGEAVRAIAAGDAVDVALERALAMLAAHNESRPRAVAAHLVREYRRDPKVARERSTFRQLLPTLFDEARDRGELPAGTDGERLAALTAAIIYSACQAWAEGLSTGLRDDLHYGMRVLLAGVRAVAGPPSA
jgi:AcrR family transcriptional regulator